MTTMLSNRQISHEPNYESRSHNNILKNKPNNQSVSAMPNSKHSLSQQKQVKQNSRNSIEQKEMDQKKLLIQKKGLKNQMQATNNLRSIIQDHEQEYKQSKPFHKKYGTNSTNGAKMPPIPPSRQQKQQMKHLPSTPVEPKYKTKESFNKKLSNNIIKDEQAPNSKHSYRIKKVEPKSPKKIRDDIIALNQEEYKLQMEILQLHKSTKKQIEEAKQNYKLNMNNQKKYFPQFNNVQQTTIEDYLTQIKEKVKIKQKQLQKLQKKIESNAYKQFIEKQPSDIMELDESEEEDEVQDLPDNRPRMENNVGSYSTAMPLYKDRKHGLNLRRTYDIFKDDKDNSRIAAKVVTDQSKVLPEEHIRQEGENKVTVNNKLREFLLD